MDSNEQKYFKLQFNHNKICDYKELIISTFNIIDL